VGFTNDELKNQPISFLAGDEDLCTVLKSDLAAGYFSDKRTRLFTKSKKWISVSLTGFYLGLISHMNGSIIIKIKNLDELDRFENKFDFNIEVIGPVDIDNIEIPSLLIQPYVENAILHGLYNKNEKGTLLIRIKEEDEAVIFEIEDDGVGREVAKKIRQQNFPSHKSMGIKLTEERLKLINSQNLASFEIEDLKDELVRKELE